MTPTSPGTPSATLADQLPYFRERLGLSQQGLADKLVELGVKSSRATIARTEAGEREIGLDEALQLAAVLDVSPTQLFLPFLGTGVTIAPNLTITAEHAEHWLMTQHQPLFGENEKLHMVAGRMQQLLDAVAAAQDADEIDRLAGMVRKELARPEWESR